MLINNIKNLKNVEIIDPYQDNLLSQFKNDKELSIEDAVQGIQILEKNINFDTILIRSGQMVKHIRDQLWIA